MPLFDTDIGDNALVRSHKIDFGIAGGLPSTVAALNSKLDTLGKPAGLDSLHEGLIAWDEDANTLNVWTGSAWQQIQTTATFSGTLNAVALAGKVITGVAEVEIEKSDTAVLFILDQNGNGGNLKLENAGTGHSIEVDDGGTSWLYVGKSGGKDVELIATATLSLLDNAVLNFGDSDDITIKWDATDLLIDGLAADTVIKIGATNNQNLQVYGATTTNYVLFDTDDTAKKVTFEHFHLELQDASALRFGDDDDITITWNATDLLVEWLAENTGVVKFGATNAGDVQFYGTTNTKHILFDASVPSLIFTSVDIRLLDDTFIKIGTGDDVTIEWDTSGTHTLKVLAGADDLPIEFGNGTNSFDVKWFADTSAKFVLCDASANSVTFDQVTLQLGDSDKLMFGDANGGDISVQWDATNLLVEWAAADTGVIKFGATTNGDIGIYGATATRVCYFDTDDTAHLFYLDGFDFRVKDDDKVQFGDDADVTITWNNTKLLVAQATANSAIEFGVDGAGLDLKLFGDTSGSFMLFDQSADKLIFDGADLRLQDDDLLSFGDSDDIAITWNNTKLVVSQATANSAIDFGVNGAGIDVVLYGDTASVNATWDQSADSLVFADNAKVVFGTGLDVTIAWDNTDLDITGVADDQVINVGNGTNSFDVKLFGNIATAFLLWEASATNAVGGLLSAQGPARLQGFNTPSQRFELKWVAGQRGKPSVNADIQNAAEATRMIADPDFEVLGTNASSDDVTFYVEGGVTIETDGADGDEVIILPHLDANQSAWAQVTWGTDQETHWECDLSTSTNITNAIVWAGLKLTNTEVTATDDNQVFFRYEDDVNGGKWQAIDSIAGVDTATDSGVTVATSTRYHLKVVILADRTARMYINGALIKTTSALANTTDLIPYIGVAADGAAAAKKINVHSQAISRLIA